MLVLTETEQSSLGPHLEVHGDGRASPLLLVVGVEQLDLGRELTLLHAAHALDPAEADEFINTAEHAGGRKRSAGSDQLIHSYHPSTFCCSEHHRMCVCVCVRERERERERERDETDRQTHTHTHRDICACVCKCVRV